MQSAKTKVMVYLILVSAVGTFLGLALLKLNSAGQTPGGAAPITARQRLKALEMSPGMKSPAAKRFLQNEENNRNETDAVFDNTPGGR